MKLKNITEILVEHTKWRESGGKEGKRADLREADLREADLSGADLREADLREADLSGAVLHGADLRGADLRGAVLHGADLHEANLRGAVLHGADLHEADLRWADLHEANLHEADLHEADIDFSCWPLWCGSLRAKGDERIARQLLYHAFAVGIEFFPGGLTEDQKTWLQKFEHATDEVNSKM